MRRHVLFIMFLLSVLLVGCAPQIVCEPPNVMVGNTCCLDINDDNICDSEKDIEAELEPEPEPVVEPEPIVEVTETDEEVFAKTFESSWNMKNYNALYKMMDTAYKRRFTQEEFNFLMKRIHEKRGIVSVSFRSMVGNDAEYIVTTADDKFKVRGETVKQTDGIKLKAFYIFTDPTVDEACDDDADCYYTYVVITGNENFCEKTGDRRVECHGMFGIEKELLAKMDECAEIKDYFTKVDCLQELALDEKTIEPCWLMDFDKQRYECMGEVAAIDEDPALCKEYANSRTMPATRIQHGHCIMGYVRETSDTKACSLIDRRDDVILGAMSENCDRLRFS